MLNAGGGGDYIPGQTVDIGLEEDRDDSMGVRIFNGIHAFQGSPENDWGMKVNWPEWIGEAHNSQSGRVFIFGSGPSLLSQADLLKNMDDEHTWTVNRIYQWKEIPFTPTYHSVAEPGPLAAWGAVVFPAYNFPTARTRIAINWWPVTAKGWLWCPKAPDDIQVRWEGAQGLSDTLAPIPTAWASPLTCSQLALWMGYTEVYILGCDTTQVGQAWDKEKGRTARPRNIRSILESAERLHRDVKRAGRTLIDLTPGGRLNTEGALEYRELEEVLA